jgi:YHS domain-containing protein
MRDPICNMECFEDKAVKTEFQGETYYFCSEGRNLLLFCLRFTFLLPNAFA